MFDINIIKLLAWKVSYEFLDYIRIFKEKEENYFDIFFILSKLIFQKELNEFDFKKIKKYENDGIIFYRSRFEEINKKTIFCSRELLRPISYLFCEKLKDKEKYLNLINFNEEINSSYEVYSYRDNLDDWSKLKLSSFYCISLKLKYSINFKIKIDLEELFYPIKFEEKEKIIINENFKFIKEKDVKEKFCFFMKKI